MIFVRKQLVINVPTQMSIICNHEPMSPSTTVGGGEDGAEDEAGGDGDKGDVEEKKDGEEED